MSDSISRRDFLKHGSVGSVCLAAAGSMKGSAVRASARGRIGPNDTLTAAVIGVNGRGTALVDCLLAAPGVSITHICDVDERAIAKGVEAASKLQSIPPKGQKDFRKLLEEKVLGAVAIATPDHWHAPMAIMALAAGKHVYVEKPCSHNPYEGELLVAAVKKYRGVLQMGAQRRSFPNLQEAIREIHSGIIGKTYFGRIWYVNKRQTIGRGKPAPVPDWLDYDLWQGPAPRRPYRDNLIHYNWHWFWHWGTGEALNNGTHELDVCRWALGVDWPVRVTSNGGRYHFEDDWETPDTQVIAWDFPQGKTISWEGRSCNGFLAERLDRGVLVYGTEGTALLDGNSYKLYDKKNAVIKEVNGNATTDRANTLSSTGPALDRLHVRDFVDAIRTGKAPNCPVEEGHKSVALLHLGNIAWRAQRELICSPQDGHILNDPEAAKLWRRDYEPGWEPIV
jgi:predicted dehydrogenase